MNLLLNDSLMFNIGNLENRVFSLVFVCFAFVVLLFV